MRNFDRTLLGPASVLAGLGVSLMGPYLESIFPPVALGLTGALLMIAGGLLTLAAFIPETVASHFSAFSGVRHWLRREPGVARASTDLVSQRVGLTLPDMTIRDLFFHIRPDLLEDLDAEDWKEVEQQLRDALALGRLRSWGVPMPKDYLEEIGFPKERNPPRLIEPDYWHDATFTFWFFQKGEQGRFGDSHTYPRHGSGVPKYCDIQFNRAEVEAVWPQSSALEDGPNWPIYELLWALKPNLDRDYRNPAPWKDTLREVRSMMRSRRTEGGPPLLRAWGTPRTNSADAGAQELIAPEYWANAELTGQALDSEWWEIGVTDKGSHSYRRVYVNKREAFSVWPRLKKL